MLIGTGVIAVTPQGLHGPKGLFTPLEGWPKGPVSLRERWPIGRFLWPQPDLLSPDTNHCGSCQSTQSTCIPIGSSNIRLHSCVIRCCEQVQRESSLRLWQKSQQMQKNRCGPCQPTAPGFPGSSNIQAGL